MPIGTRESERIDQFLAEALSEAERIFASNPRLESLFQQLRGFILRGGKRVRPRLCLASFRILDGRTDPPKSVWQVAISLEMFHAFMLIHDDIIDCSVLRRDEPTLHEALRPVESLGSERADAKRGGDLAILGGDLLCALAMRLVARAGLVDESLGRACRLLADMLVETGVGEVMDVVSESDPLDCLDESTLIETYLRKTARYTISGPMVLGATVAGASPVVCSALDRFGDLLGLSFQINNDLNALGRDPATGDHSDLDSGKRTYLLWSAYHSSTRRRRSEMRDLLARPHSIERRMRLHQLIVGSGAVGRCRARIQQLNDQALESLLEPGLSTFQRIAFIELVEQLGLKPSGPLSESFLTHSILPIEELTPRAACRFS
ncbi:MAG: polyprenyl synthetase family protein [Isosphaeraceae bacterium]|nr:polyprenyl synthetase family protein [Isosphaeraceae bacterium]